MTADQITMVEPTAPCTRPPQGWRCTRGAGHPGPCAAVHESMEHTCEGSLRTMEVLSAARAVQDSFNRYSHQPTTTLWEQHRRTIEMLGRVLA